MSDDLVKVGEALERACAENIALRVMLGVGCDANNDGPHMIVGSGKEAFCHLCGEMTPNGKSKPWFNDERLERTISRLARAHSQEAERG